MFYISKLQDKEMEDANCHVALDSMKEKEYDFS